MGDSLHTNFSIKFDSTIFLHLENQKIIDILYLKPKKCKYLFQK